jgi:hypothetical protein
VKAEAIRPGPGRWCYFENAREMLDQRGEWYLDRAAGVLSYKPRSGEEPAQARVTAPRLACLIAVKGTPDRPVRNLHFRGLCFAHTGWSLPKRGYPGIQACHYSVGKGEEEEEGGDRWPVIYSTSDEHVRFNECSRDWHTWRDNHFGEPAAVQQSGKDTISQAGPEPEYRRQLGLTP